ncbi:MAG: alpha/beta hydrolase [Aureispira sp.]|nr:alpha/beta hydrolase [Aureispira sp.]
MATKVVLVHGLNGELVKTWGSFPDLLHDDPELDVSVVSYGYGFFYKPFIGANESIHNIAEGLAAEIDLRCSPEDKLILVGHSLGGLIIRKYLLNQYFKEIMPNVSKVCFFAVPQNGSGFSDIASLIGWRHQQLKALCKDNKYLEEMNDQWVSTKIANNFEILSVIGGRDDIVTSESSKSIFRDSDIKMIEGKGHIDIVKPDNCNDSSYLALKQFINKKNTVMRYKNKQSRNLNDWKSIDRNHGYQYVSDEQRDKNLESLTNAIDRNKSVIRLTGASGLGKTRLLLEAIHMSSTINDECILVFNGADYVEQIKESVRHAVDDNALGLIIVENCSVDLHNELAREVNKTECQLRIVTIGYSPDPVSLSISIQISTLAGDAIQQLLTPILVGMESYDVQRVARFAQGYPLMAVLIAEQYQRNGQLLGSIEDSSVVKKLIEGGVGIGESEKNVLTACSLFDVFGTEQSDAAAEAKYITEQIANSAMQTFDRVLSVFSRRQIINRAGRYARVVPKPLALTLASEWWEEASYERQKAMIDGMPESLVRSFCTQATYLDSHSSVQRFSERLFGGNSPFVQAEVLLTEKGSKLFRAFVEVNPEATSTALYNVLKNMTFEQLQSIDGDTRRNLVWALEKLCFHAHVFEKAAWCMLLLASAENETWSNNATGMFAQLFRVNNSGTAAEPQIRFALLKKALNLNIREVDMIVLEALGEAISTFGGSRTIGAEYQGTKPPLEEWRPKVWQQIFDYWQDSFDLLLVLFERGDIQTEKVLSEIGRSIRGMVSRGRIEMLDAAIRHMVSRNGRYWPAALESIKHSFDYDAETMNEEARNALNSWLELLKPDKADVSEKLKILVINPPWEHHKGEDGHYVDVAAENAKNLATEIVSNIDLLIPNINLLLQGEQKQSFHFGRQLALEVDNVDQLLDACFEKVLVAEPKNPSFILGIYSGIYDKSKEVWQACIDRLLSDKKLVVFYPNFIRTGEIKKSHLDVLLDLIRNDVVEANSANALSYGSVTDSLDPQTIVEFCLSLSELGSKASWSALNVIFMYCFSNKDNLENIRESLKVLVTAVPLHKDQNNNSIDIYHWHDLAKKLLKIRDEEFAIALINQLIIASKFGFEHGDLWSYTKPLLTEIMRDYSGVLWPIFSDAIVHAEDIELYWLQQLLDRENGFEEQIPSVLSVVPVELVIAWCTEFPDLGPEFVAGCINILEIVDEQHQPSKLFIAILENFGGGESVESALRVNMRTRSWYGSLVPYLENDKATLRPLLEYSSGNVKRWVKEYIIQIDKQIEYESSRDDEQNLGIY